jgi:hypothetical protein
VLISPSKKREAIASLSGKAILVNDLLVHLKSEHVVDLESEPELQGIRRDVVQKNVIASDPSALPVNSEEKSLAICVSPYMEDHVRVESLYGRIAQ